MNATRLILVLLACLLATQAAAKDQQGSAEPRTTRIDSVVVTGIQESLGQYYRTIALSDQIQDVLLKSPFQLIRRGSASVSDLYSDGLKRHDITFTVDGERFTTACPNRMDTRVGQIDLMEIETVDMNRNSASMQAGLGGQVNFRRRLPGQQARTYGQIRGAFDHSEEFDGSLAIEGKKLRIGGRYRSSNPYTDADGRTFEDLYGYSQEVKTEIYELRGHAAFSSGDAVATYENSKNVLFPYLLMDERENDHYQASVSVKGNRVYFNHTEHLMDNVLRTSANMTDMVTEAKNTMFGLVGSFYEVYARRWDATNHIIPLSNPAMGKFNHMLPDVWRYGASLQHKIGTGPNPWLSLRAGAVQTRVGDDSQLALFQTLQPDAELDQWSFPLGATASHLVDLSSQFLLGLSAELSSDAPGVQQQFIATDKPGTKPDWIGNPTLKDPVRATVRAALQREALQLEFFATHIWNYPYLVKQTQAMAMFQTYDGVDALLAGANIFATWKYFDGGINWNWGEKTEDKSPMAEIQPVTFFLKATSPTFGRFYAHALYQHAEGQKRVDESLDETSTGAWNRVDLGLVFEHGKYRVAADVENLSNVLYSQHLSYLRSPFASGVRVFEPGRTFRLTAGFGF